MYLLLIILFLIPPVCLLYSVVLYFITRVPDISTPRGRLPIIMEAAMITPESVVYDLGCGKGRFLFAAVARHPKKIVGIERSPMDVLFIRIKSWVLGLPIIVRRQDFFTVDIREADVIYLFLVQPMVIRLWEKIKKEAKRGARVIVLSDAIPSEMPTQVLLAHPDRAQSSKIYVYTVV